MYSFSIYASLSLVLQNDKKTQLEGKLKDVRFRLSAQRKEVEQTNQTRETRIAEITLLQQQLQVRKNLQLYMTLITETSDTHLKTVKLVHVVELLEIQ